MVVITVVVVVMGGAARYPAFLFCRALFHEFPFSLEGSSGPSIPHAKFEAVRSTILSFPLKSLLALPGAELN